jgi:hypothetical protein
MEWGWLGSARTLNVRPRVKNACSAALSYAPDDSSTKKWQRRQVPPQFLLSSWNDPERHQGAVERSVWLLDANERDAGLRKPCGETAQRHLVGHGQHDRVRSARQRSGARLTCRVHDVRGLDSSWEIRANDDVVRQMERSGGFSALPRIA